jgi:hypothetical protein
MESKRPGRKSKGTRKKIAARVPLPLADALAAEAARRGMTITDLLGFLAAREVGMTYQPQEALPISA